MVSLNGISPDAGGIIIVNLIGYTGAGQTGSRTFGYLNGLEIQSNPFRFLNARLRPSQVIGR